MTMTSKGAQTTDPKITRPFIASWPPGCRWCGFVGEPNDEQSPYLACVTAAERAAGVGGDIRRHYRDPVAIVDGEYVAHLDHRVERIPASRLPTREQIAGAVHPPADGKSGRTIIGRIRCPRCRRPDTAVVEYADGKRVINAHGPYKSRCPASETEPPTR